MDGRTEVRDSSGRLLGWMLVTIGDEEWRQYRFPLQVPLGASAWFPTLTLGARAFRDKSGERVVLDGKAIGVELLRQAPLFRQAED